MFPDGDRREIYGHAVPLFDRGGKVRGGLLAFVDITARKQAEQKLHEADPMTVDQALYQMELVGHPFFLFIDEETMQPCVVYHRRGWTYGVLRLNAVVSG